MEIRKLHANDAAAYWDVRMEALRSEPSAFGMAAEEFGETSVAEMEKRLVDLSPESFYLGAWESERLVGIASFIRESRIKEKHKAHIYGVYVAASHRGRGLGRALMTELLVEARRQGSLEQILLAVATDNAAAVALYRDLGFEVYGTEPRALRVEGKYIDEHMMVLKLR